MTPQLSQDELFRYSRHLIMPQVGLEGQKKLKGASVLIIGTGGLGSPVALYLAAAGIGRIGLVDDDSVEISNLQRQILHDTLHEGQPKVVSGQERLLALNPSIHVEAILDCFNARSAQKIAEGYDILVDCSDNFATRYLVNDLCVLTHRPDVYGAVYRFEGQVSVFDARYGACYRCAFPEPPPPEFSHGCDETGILGVLPGVIGTLQAAEVLKLALNIGQPLYGKLLVYDALSVSFQTIKVAKQDPCKVCGMHPVLTSLDSFEHFCPDDLVSLTADELISPSDLKVRLSQANLPMLVDVRNLVEQQVSSIPGAIHIPMEKLAEGMKTVEKDREIILFCRNGRRSARAVMQLKARGFSKAKSLAGGINAWVDEIGPKQFKY
jgi:sulfur-carrier protein adenylyltransferase/sulfurtransferase